MLRLRVPLPRLIGPGEVVAGEGALAALQALPATRVALVASDRAASDPVVLRWLQLVRPFEVRRFKPSWRDEPDLAAIGGTLAEISGFRPDWIIAVGGGSTIDGARLCWALYEHPHFPRERLSRPFSLPPLRALARFVAVPTTTGTGAECSSAAVFTEGESGRKVPVVTHDFLPDIVILEPRLTAALPRKLTVLTALDGLAHALEGRASTLANPLVDDIAASSAATILEVLFKMRSDSESPALRSRLQIATYYAGQVQNLRLVGIAHAIAHRLGRLDVPHSAAVGCLLPLSLRLASRVGAVRTTYDDIARRCGLADTAAMIDAIRDLLGDTGLSGRLRDAARTPGGFSPAQALQIATDALDDPIARVLPFRMEPDELAGHVEAAW